MQRTKKFVQSHDEGQPYSSKDANTNILKQLFASFSTRAFASVAKLGYSRSRYNKHASYERSVGTVVLDDSSHILLWHVVIEAIKPC